AEAAPHLLQLAHADDPKLHDAGLRGYVRIARDEESVGLKTTMLSEAMQLTREPAEKWLVLAALGTLHTPASLQVLAPHLDDPAVRNEAGAAMIGVATELAKVPETKPLAMDAFSAVIEKCEDAGIRARAEQARGNSA